MELRHLRYFIAVAEELSFSRAAEQLRIAQPPLSQQIQALEAELGVKLFDRKKRPLQLTLAGQAFLEEARSILLQLEQSVLKTQSIHLGESGYLTIGFTSSITNGVLPNILRMFQEHYPAVKLILREGNNASQIQKLRDRLVDLIFVYQYQSGETDEFVVAPIAQEFLVAVLPAPHPLAAQQQIALVDLADQAFVMPLYQVVPGLTEQIYRLCAQQNFVPQVAQEAIFMVTILGLVAGGIGVSLLPSSAQTLRREGVVFRPLQDATETIQLSAIWRRQDESPILQQFLTVIGIEIDRRDEA
ncbi:MAG: LysR family transcriptional regulator [Elainella sp. Prado103]|jgi:DNA-binding transcriptional LysR family regulator|nr:LysR family transcriptional regulator [Elainella sp. Prado103]